MPFVEMVAVAVVGYGRIDFVLSNSFAYSVPVGNGYTLLVLELAWHYYYYY